MHHKNHYHSCEASAAQIHLRCLVLFGQGVRISPLLKTEECFFDTKRLPSTKIANSLDRQTKTVSRGSMAVKSGSMQIGGFHWKPTQCLADRRLNSESAYGLQ